MLIRFGEVLGRGLAGMPVAEFAFGVAALSFVFWGLADVLGFIRYNSSRSTVITAGTGKIGLGAAALCILGYSMDWA